jgi:pimeloyl-ACP methyl ester carboxylesterase
MNRCRLVSCVLLTTSLVACTSTVTAPPTSSSGAPSAAASTPAPTPVRSSNPIPEAAQVAELLYAGAEFYAPPDPLPPAPPGTLIRVQRIDPGDAPVRIYRVLYHSTSFVGDLDTAVSGTIWVPAGPSPLGGYPIMAFGHGNDGSADICANSKPDRMDGIWYWPFALEMVRNGYVFAYTDYEGLGTPGPMMFAVREAMGRSALDSVRAAHDLLGSAVGDRAVAYGHSLGAWAALGAGEIAPDYAPDANLKAVVVLSGGDLIHPEPSPPDATSRVFMQAVAGLSAAFPGLRADDVLTPKGLAELHWIEETCELDAVFGDTLIAEMVDTPPHELASWVDALNEINARSAPTPVFLAVGGLEDESLADGMRETAAVLCQTSDDVRFTVVPGADHDSIVFDTLIDALPWMTGWMDGRPQPGNCVG